MIFPELSCLPELIISFKDELRTEQSYLRGSVVLLVVMTDPVMYLTDGVYFIQAEISREDGKSLPGLDIYNKQKTGFYKQNQIEMVNKLVKAGKQPKITREINIQECTFRLVNVNCSYQYSLLLQIHSFSYKGLSNPLPPFLINNILADTSVDHLMAEERLKDIRRYPFTRTPKIQQISMCYYIRHHQHNHTNKHVFVKTDPEFMKYSPELKISYIPVNMAEGVYYSHEPFNFSLKDYMKHHTLFMEQVQSVVNNRISEEGIDVLDLGNTIDSEEYSNDLKEEDDSDGSLSDDSEEDYLKKAYQKYNQNSKIGSRVL